MFGSVVEGKSQLGTGDKDQCLLISVPEDKVAVCNVLLTRMAQMSNVLYGSCRS